VQVGFPHDGLEIRSRRMEELVCALEDSKLVGGTPCIPVPAGDPRKVAAPEFCCCSSALFDDAARVACFPAEFDLV
jgi:hypothetical protein